MSVPAAESLFWSLMDAAAKSTVIFALALVAVQLGRGSAALRHAMRTFAMVAVLLLPIAVLLLPAWEWRILPATPVVQPAAAALPPLPGDVLTPARNEQRQSYEHFPDSASATTGTEDS